MTVKRWKTVIRWTFAAAIVFWLVSSAWITSRLTGRRYPQSPEPVPEVAWGPIETLRLTTSDGERLGAWLTRGAPHGDCVLLLHANGRSRRAMLSIARSLTLSGYTTLSITFRAHGDSTGNENDFGFSGRHDVVAAVEYLEREFPGRRIFVVGRSLGAAAAIFASEQLGGRIAGYLLEAPYKDLDSAVWYRLQTILPPVFDYAAFAGMRLWAPAFVSVDPGVIAPSEHVSAIPKNVSVTMLFGTRDRWAPLEDGHQLAHGMQAAVKIVAFDGASHRSLHAWDPDRYEAALFDLLKHSQRLSASAATAK